MNRVAKQEKERRTLMHERELRLLLQRLIGLGGYATRSSLAVYTDGSGDLTIDGVNYHMPAWEDLRELEKCGLVARVRLKHTIWKVTEHGRQWSQENPA